MTEEPCLLCGNKTCLRVGQSSNCSESKRPKTWKRYTLKSKYSSMKSEHKTTAKHCISCLQNVDEDYQSLGQLKFCDICNGENKWVCVVCISPNEYPHGECIATIKERAQFWYILIDETSSICGWQSKQLLAMNAVNTSVVYFLRNLIKIISSWFRHIRLRFQKGNSWDESFPPIFSSHRAPEGKIRRKKCLNTEKSFPASELHCGQSSSVKISDLD